MTAQTELGVYMVSISGGNIILGIDTIYALQRRKKDVYLKGSSLAALTRDTARMVNSADEFVLMVRAIHMMDNDLYLELVYFPIQITMRTPTAYVATVTLIERYWTGTKTFSLAGNTEEEAKNKILSILSLDGSCKIAEVC